MTTDDLGSAWAALEAVLPEGVEILLSKDVLNPPESRYEVEACARTLSEGLTSDDWTFTANFRAQFASGPTPAAAVWRLVARLEVKP